MSEELRRHLLEGQVIPAHPLALDRERRLDERRQRALTRYYLAAGVGGIAVGVHTTQFAIRDCGLYGPVLELASRTADESLAERPRGFVKVAGLCGGTKQAVAEAEAALRCGYHCGLLSLAAWQQQPEVEILAHCRVVAETIPLFGFYLQPSVGGRVLSCSFWGRFLEIPQVVAIKIAPFNRYRTLDVVRAAAGADRDDVALYTGNDDQIVLDLLTPWEIASGGERPRRRIVGGLLGHWSVWTRRAVELLEEVRRAREEPVLQAAWLARAVQVTDVNAALFDAANGFAGCIAGLHEVLRRQGLLEGTWCLDAAEGLSPGQAAAIDRVYAAYPEQHDDHFVAAHRDEWLQ